MRQTVTVWLMSNFIGLKENLGLTNCAAYADHTSSCGLAHVRPCCLEQSFPSPHS